MTEKEELIPLLERADETPAEQKTGGGLLAESENLQARDRPENADGGTKPIIRADSAAFLTTDRGRDVADEIRAFAFFECSAKTREGVRDVFEAAVKATKRDNKQCVLL